MLAIPQDQRSDDPPAIGQSASQFGLWETDLRDMVLTLSGTTCTICRLASPACGLDDLVQLAHPDERQRVSDTVLAALRAGARIDPH